MTLKIQRAHQKTIISNIDKLRLLVAREIICYAVNTRDEHSHIWRDPATEELFDQYSLKICLNWLALKWGFPIYQGAIHPARQADLHILESWEVLTDRYPFYSFFPAEFEDRLSAKAFQFLDKNFEPELQLIGQTYMQTMTSSISLDAEYGAYIEKGSTRRRGGEFYTPDWLAGECLRKPLLNDSLHLINELRRISGIGLNAEVRQFCRYRMLDPACGTGNFLLAALRLITEYLQPSGEEATLVFATNCLYGFDIDAKAVALAQTLVLLAVSKPLANAYRTLGDRKFFGLLNNIVSQLRQRIRCTDALTLGHTTVEQSQDDKFDLVVANPPYISYGARNQPKLLESSTRFLRNQYPASSEYKIRLHSIFQDLCLRLTKRQGQTVLLVPDAFLNGAYYTKLRQLLLEQAEIVSFTELPEDTFKDATAGRWCIAHYRPRDFDSQKQSLDTVVRLTRFNDSRHAGQGPQEMFETKLSRIVSKDKQRFQLLFNEEDAHLFEILKNLAPVSSMYRGYTGIRSRLGQAAITAEEPRTKGNWQKGIISGSSVIPHQTHWSGHWLDISPEKLFAGGFAKHVIGPPKLLVRQTADRLIGGIDETGLYHLNNVHSFAPIDESEETRLHSLHRLDGLLNSSLWLYLYQLKSRETGRALAQIDIEMVESLPLPELNTEIEEMIVSVVGALRIQPNAALERVLDRLIYDLYDLSESEITHIEKTLYSAPRRASKGKLPGSSEALKLLESSLKTTV